MREQIAALAYQLWEKGGREAGRDQEYWFQAENQLKAASQPVPSQTTTPEHSRKPFTQTRNTGVSHVRGGNGRLRSEVARS